ncbi:predicted protein [Sclerotinia sclerotiorum 1980 UF-70]|uniref:Uncharacterized protein n=1 Tax=Sclerotinia sclerotiorum (strain ATCC 18683 / 1980 / Ss-1) TaxID=665079 RepID=A7F1T3_SCLS1|nr:predicted protein [Sclerotinia sclerotiorum 1980 UF-70]EDN95675.1 predicted protein [Sclerotinia sclerotiorum 1980 UF-70]
MMPSSPRCPNQTSFTNQPFDTTFIFVVLFLRPKIKAAVLAIRVGLEVLNYNVITKSHFAPLANEVSSLSCGASNPYAERITDRNG